MVSNYMSQENKFLLLPFLLHTLYDMTMSVVYVKITQ